MFVLMATSPGDDLFSPTTWPVAASEHKPALELHREKLMGDANVARRESPNWYASAIACKYTIKEVPKV